MQAPAVNVPPAPSVLTRLLIRSWEYRHPGAWVGMRTACGIFTLGFGALLLFYGFWVRAIPLAGMALIFWIACQGPAHVEN